jgi:RND family efflux transporter MFP subunit
MRLDARYAVAALPLVLAACGQPAQTAGEKPRGVPVRTVTVETRDLEDVLVLTGTLRPRAQVSLVAEVSARLVRVARDEGSRVGAGDVLAVLDETDYRLSNERAKAAVQVAEANRAHAQAEKERAAQLLKTGGITDKDRLAAEVAVQVAEASLAHARAEAGIAAQQLSRGAIRAPFAGRVAKRLADPGAMLAVGTPVFTFVDDSVLEFRASVPSASYPKVKLGDTARIKVDSLPGLEVVGRVARLSPLVDERNRSFEVVVEVPGNPALVGGLFARAEVRTGQAAGALVVPPAALVRDGGKPGEAEAFVVSQGKAQRRAVILGVEGPQAVQVSQGLSAGDVVVLDPPVALSDGATVEISKAPVR